MKDLPDIRLVEEVAKRILRGSCSPKIEHVQEGVSTYVYRIYLANEVFYLRVLPEQGASFAPEVLVHQLLRDKHVKVPKVVYFEHQNEILQRSIMMTTEIKGKHLDSRLTDEELRSIVVEAGRELALVNSIPVQGFGWMRRDQCEITHLEAEHPSYKGFIEEHLESDLVLLAKSSVLRQSDIAAIRQILKRFDAMLDTDQAWLSHGDFDMTHIYQDQGHYTGIIDFGEIRGTDALYDLGHFHMHDGETLPILVFPYLLEGYKQMAPLPTNYEQRIILFSLLIAIRTLSNARSKHRDIRKHQSLKSIPGDIQALFA